MLEEVLGGAPARTSKSSSFPAVFARRALSGETHGVAALLPLSALLGDHALLTKAREERRSTVASVDVSERSRAVEFCAGET